MLPRKSKLGQMNTRAAISIPAARLTNPASGATISVHTPSPASAPASAATALMKADAMLTCACRRKSICRDSTV